jgi:hypothetical protein
MTHFDMITWSILRARDYSMILSVVIIITRKEAEPGDEACMETILNVAILLFIVKIEK